jgi:neutral ceramidase
LAISTEGVTLRILMKKQLYAGAAETDISPSNSQFLVGYPHVERYSTGIHDPLISSALYLTDGKGEALFIANDIIYLSKSLVQEIREKITEKTGIPGGNIMISATHTHSGPVTAKHVGTNTGSLVPPPDPEYIESLKEKLCSTAERAVSGAKPAELGLAVADNTGVGTNRRDPDGPRNPVVPVLSVRNADTKEFIALMLACSMHPTVLHEDSTLISADFPGMTKAYLKKQVASCPVLYHTSPAGNQSPRHVTRSNTFEEAKRLGEILGKSVESIIPGIRYIDQLEIQTRQTFVPLPLNTFPDVETAEKLEKKAREKLERMRTDGSSPRHTRTAECDWFGAERRLTLAKLNSTGELAEKAAERGDAEVQLIAVGPWRFISWPGEIFVEYALEVMEKEKNTFVLAYTNGESQGYLVTPEAAEEGGYEAATALFKSPESPRLLVKTALELCGSVTSEP